MVIESRLFTFAILIYMPGPLSRLSRDCNMFLDKEDENLQLNMDTVKRERNL